MSEPNTFFDLLGYEALAADVERVLRDEATRGLVLKLVQTAYQKGSLDAALETNDQLRRALR